VGRVDLRCYKDAVPPEEARALMRRGSGSHFDPRVLAAFDAMAAAVHREIWDGDEARLRETLRVLVARHFQGSKAEGAPA
jgi:hypothetical protein